MHPQSDRMNMVLLQSATKKDNRLWRKTNLATLHGLELQGSPKTGDSEFEKRNAASPKLKSQYNAKCNSVFCGCLLTYPHSQTHLHAG